MEKSLQYPLTSYRYVNLVVFLLACCVNSLTIPTLASINSMMQNRFNYSPQIITLLILMGPVMHPIMATPCNWILDRFGVRVGCSFGGLLLILGAWSRILLQDGDATWPIIGAILSSMGNIFILSSPSAFALKWFPNDAVSKVIAIAVLFNYLSSGIGASIAGIILHPDATVSDIKQFFQLQAIILTIPFILLAIFYKQSPPSPPSKAAQGEKNKIAKDPYIETIKKLVKNVSYIKTILSMSFSYGIFISFISVLNQCLFTLGYETPSHATSATIASAMFLGLFSTIFFTFTVRKSQAYKKIISLCLLGVLLGFLILNSVFLFEIKQLWVIGLAAGACGFFVIPLTALFTTYSSQLTYPVAQGSATGYLFAGSQTVGFLIGMISVVFLDKQSKWKVYTVLGVHAMFIVASFLISLKTKEVLNKTMFQKGQSKFISQQNTFQQSLLFSQNQQA